MDAARLRRNDVPRARLSRHAGQQCKMALSKQAASADGNKLTPFLLTRSRHFRAPLFPSLPAAQTQNAWFTYLATAGIGNKRIGKPLMNLSQTRWRHGRRVLSLRDCDLAVQLHSISFCLACCCCCGCCFSVGVMDIVLAGLVLLVYPLPLAHAWCVVWGLATALMRPLSGESIHQFIERSGNFIPALALLWIESQAGLTEHAFDFYVKLIGAAMAAGFVFCALLRVTGIVADKTKQAKA